MQADASQKEPLDIAFAVGSESHEIRLQTGEPAVDQLRRVAMLEMQSDARMAETDTVAGLHEVGLQSLLRIGHVASDQAVLHSRIVQQTLEGKLERMRDVKGRCGYETAGLPHGVHRGFAEIGRQQDRAVVTPWRGLHRQHRTGRESQQLLGRGTDNPGGETVRAVLSHHYQIGTEFARGRGDLVCRPPCAY